MTTRWRKCRCFPVVLILFLSQICFAEGTRTWEQSKFDELAKGTANGVALRSRGGLELAPSFKLLSTTPSTYIWAIAIGTGGDLFVAAGGPARVYRVTTDGKVSAIFQPQELQVQAIAVGKDGAIYAATNPDGKIYRLQRDEVGTAKSAKSDKAVTSNLEEGWKSSVFFDPKTKYIWDFAFDAAGNLYVATGDHGEIFRVTSKGEHSVFFKSDDAHIRALAFDAKGNLIAGSDGSGLIYRITPDGEAFVIYSAPKKEITALAVDAAGNIYAAGVGEKRPGTPSVPLFPTTPVTTPAPSAAPGSGPQTGITITSATVTTSPMTGFVLPGATVSGGSEIYRIAPDGSPTQLWGSREDLVYALDFDQHGTLLAGTGNKGHIYAILGEDAYVDMAKAIATQVTALAKSANGSLYAATSNLGKIFLLGSSPATEGTYESDVFDARNFSRWGRLELRGRGNVELFARSGNVDNPDRNWSAWKKVDLQKDSEVAAPAARFLQWKAVLHASDPAPVLDSVTANYLQKNIAPDFDNVTVQLGVRYQPLPKFAASAEVSSTSSSQQHFESPVPSMRDPNSIGVKWSVHDDNDDQMVYSVFYRGDGETRWLLLKNNLTDKFYSFDASFLPDGGYAVKVIASDAPSHSPGEALTSERESLHFDVDNTAPQIENLNASVENGKIHITFRAVDSFSNIKRAEYSVDASEWQFIEPAGQLSDSKTESYDFLLPEPPSGGNVILIVGSIIQRGRMPAEHVVAVRAYDHYDNLGSAKIVVREK